MTAAGTRSGLGGLAGIYAAALARLRRSPSLRRSLVSWLVAGMVFTEAFDLILAAAHGSGVVVAVIGGVVWWLAIAAVMVGGAALLRTPDGTEIDRYGIPNGLSALRAWACLPLLLCAVWTYPHDLGFILWGSAGGLIGMLDYVDGLLARRIGPVTELGKAIDPAMDALFFSVAGYGSVLLGMWPWWLAVLTLVRYLGPLLLTPLVFLSGRRPELVRTVWGRRNTAATGIVLFVCLWVRIFNGPVDLVAAIVGLPLLVPTTLLHFNALLQRVRSAPRS